MNRMLTLTLGALALSMVQIAPATADTNSLFGAAKSLLNKATGGETGTDLSSGEIADGLREALRIGSETVADQLGAVDGFNGDPTVHIPLPDSLKTAQSMLKKVGFGSLGDEVELKMNRAAESAMAETRTIVVAAIQAMTLDDAKGILTGPDDAATQYLQRVSGSDIRGKIRPIVDQALTEVGAVAAVDAMMARYKILPFVPDVKSNLTEHATDKAYDGLFHYIAQEEAAIRENPAKRTTELLQKVFAE